MKDAPAGHPLYRAILDQHGRPPCVLLVDAGGRVPAHLQVRQAADIVVLPEFRVAANEAQA